MPSVSGGSELVGFSLRKRAVEDELRSEVGRLGSTGALNWKNSYSAVVRPYQQEEAMTRGRSVHEHVHNPTSSPPAIAAIPSFPSLSTAVFSRPLGHALIGPRVSGSIKLTKKKGTSSSHGILLKLLRSGTAIISLYPFSALLIFNSLKYVWSCMSQPNSTEQKPKPSFAIERNFFLDMSFPLRVPSMSTPATLTLVSFSRS